MSRSYAQFATSMWRPESDWNDLASAEQRMHMLLESQEDISAAGVLTLAVDRWAGNARDTTAETVQLAIKGLVEAGKVAVDERTQEILVRSFVKSDRGYNNTKRRPVIVRAALEIRSATLRNALAEELSKLGINIDSLASPGRSVPGMRDGLSDRASESARLDPVRDRTPSEYSQVDSLSDLPCDGTPASEGVVVTNADHVEPPSRNPQSTTPEALRDVADQVRAVRPTWNISTVENAIRNALAAGNTLHAIEAELLVLANDDKTRSPGRLNAPGRYWITGSTLPTVAAFDVDPSQLHAFRLGKFTLCADCSMPKFNRRHDVEGTA